MADVRSSICRKYAASGEGDHNTIVVATPELGYVGNLEAQQAAA
jgi:hypothetical protein